MLEFLPGIAQIAGSFLSHQNNINPAEAASPFFNQIPGTIKPYYDPYISAGKESLGSLMGQYRNLINDPESMLKKVGRGFQQSPGYQYQFNQAMNASNNAAAAGGMLGTPFHQQNSATLANNLANQDYYNYLGNVLGLYDKGLGGMEGINQKGFGASDTLAQALAANLMNQGNLAYAGAEHENAQTGDLFSGVMKGIGSLFDW